MRVGVSARRGNVVGADDKWRCLFAGNRGANGFDCGKEKVEKTYHPHPPTREIMKKSKMVLHPEPDI